MIPQQHILFCQKGEPIREGKKGGESRKNGPSMALPQTLGLGHFKASLYLGGF